MELRRYLNLNGMRRAAALLSPYMAGQWKAYSGLVLALLVDVSLTFAFAWFMGTITDAAVQGDFDRMKALLPYGVLFILLSIGTAFGNEYLDTVAVEAVRREVKARVYKHILLMPADRFHTYPSGQLLSYFTHDVDNMDGILGSNLMRLIKLPFISAGILIYLFQLSWKLSLLVLLVMPIALLTGAVFGVLLRQSSLKIHQLAGKTSSLLAETLWGLTVIRAYTLEKFFDRSYAGQNRERYVLELNNAKLRGWFHAGGDAFGSIVFVLSLGLGAYFVINAALSVGSLLAFVNLTNHLIYPLTGFAGLWAGVQRSVSAVERLAQFLEQPVEQSELPEPLPPQSFQQGIEFHQVTFSYDGKNNVLGPFRLHILAGQTTAIVGPSGAGKSTLLYLLQRFYKPQSGHILIDGRSVDTMVPAELRSLFAFVSQETFLFSGSIRENLLMARPGITEAEMLHAAAAAHLHPFIMSLPDGYATDIGERGLSLSGGQRQRLAIARALLKDAPILLLDEATSALDSDTEQQVQDGLARLMRNRTTLVIAHRLSTIQHADRIVVMDQGRIVQTGRHDELIVQDGLYRHLYYTQFQKRGRDAAYFLDSSVI